MFGNPEEDAPKSLSEMKIERFKKALIRHDGNVSAACDDLEISRDTAYRWMKKHKRLKRLTKTLRDGRNDQDYDE